MHTESGPATDALAEKVAPSIVPVILTKIEEVRLT